jgi:hypothetical protein
MPKTRQFPSPDGGKAEQLLRSQIGRAITDLFHIWDDPYKAPETMFQEGQVMINAIAELVQESALSRDIIHRDKVTGELALGKAPN